MIKVYCESCDGHGVHYHEDYDYDENYIGEIESPCSECEGKGYVEKPLFSDEHTAKVFKQHTQIVQKLAKLYQENKDNKDKLEVIQSLIEILK